MWLKNLVSRKSKRNHLFYKPIFLKKSEKIEEGCRLLVTGCGYGSVTV